MRFSAFLSFGLLMTVAGTLTGCFEKEDASPATDGLVFGRYAGFCQGEQCIEIYKLSTVTETLLEDQRDQYPQSDVPYDGQYAPIEQEYYEQARDLTRLVPARLLELPNGKIGQPDAGDWGGYYLEVSSGNQRRYWLIDTQKDHLPAFLHPLADTLAKRIAKLP